MDKVIAKLYQWSANAKLMERILVVIVLIVFAGTFTHGFVLDDYAVIVANKYVQQGVSGMADILAHPSLSGFIQRPQYNGEPINDYYRPVALLMFAFEHSLHAGPAIGHVVNVVIYALCVLVGYRLLLRLSASPFLAFLSALLFALHPLHTEVVANIKSRDELMATLLGFTAFLLAFKYTQTQTLKTLGYIAICALLALCSKESALVLLILIPLAMLLRLSPRPQLLLVSASLSVAVISYLVVRQYILITHNAYHPELVGFTENQLVAAPSKLVAFATSLAVIFRYFMLLLFPYPLSADYSFNSIPFYSFTDYQVYLALFIVLGLILLAVTIYRKQRDVVPVLGVALLLLPILLLSNIFFVTGTIMAERFMFVPVAGFAMLLAWMVINVPSVSRPWAVSAVLILLPIYTFATIHRNTAWASNLTLCTTDVQHYSHNARLWQGIGSEYNLIAANSASDMEKREAYSQAAHAFTQSLSIFDAQGKVHADLAQIHLALGNIDSAKFHFRRSLDIVPDEPAFLSAYGGLFFSLQQYDSTIQLCRQALIRAKANTALLANIGMCYIQLQQYKQALAIADSVLHLDPEHAVGLLVRKASLNAMDTSSKQPLPVNP